MRPFPHKPLIKCMRDIKLKTFNFSTPQINLVNMVKSFPMWKPIQITPSHQEPFGLQKYQLYLYANVLKRHILSVLVHMRTLESECKSDTRNCCKENVWKGPSLVSFTYVLRSWNIEAHMHNISTCSIWYMYHNIWHTLLAKSL